MKKITLLMLCLVLLAGCNAAKKRDRESMNLYETYWKSLLNETQFLKESRNFNIEVDFIKEPDGFEYYITVDQPRTAMYDVEIMVIENAESFSVSEEMLPSAGIFEQKFNMIPNQVRNESNYKEGAILARQELQSDEISLRVLVTWKNYTKLDSFKEVFEFDLKYEEPEKKDKKSDKKADKVEKKEEKEEASE